MRVYVTKIFFIALVLQSLSIALARNPIKMATNQENENIQTQSDTTQNDNGWYWLNKGGLKINYLGASYTMQFYRKQALFRNYNPYIFSHAEVNAGFSAELTSYARLGGFVDFQPFNFFGIATTILYEGAWSPLGYPVQVSSRYNYAHAVTGMSQSNIPQIKVGGNALIAQVMPYFIFGIPVHNDYVVLIYRPIITYYHIAGVDSKALIYHSTDNIVIHPNDVHFVHDILLLYSNTTYGLRLGVAGTIEHIASMQGLWRYGIFGIAIYHNPLPNNKKFIPFATLKAGTWLKDIYYQNTFTLFAEVGLKWKVF